MSTTIKADLCIIGAGSGGLSVAAGAAQMGARVVLIEKHKMGGDCLNYGCVPSKALIAAAHAADVVRGAGQFGVNGHEPDIDFLKVHDHVKGVIAAIAPHDSVERFEGLGVDVIQDHGRFVARREVEAGGHRIRARRFVIATGSKAAVPTVEGIDDVPYLTNETVFDLTERPEHLIVIGGGPIGSELAQAHRRLGARVTLLQRSTILPKDDPDAVDVVRMRLIEDGVAVREMVDIRRVERDGNGIAVTLRRHGVEERLTGTHLLIAAGRRPNVEGLGLEDAGIAYTPQGIDVDDRLRTSNRRVFAIGDVSCPYQFTHVAGYHAGIVIRNALFHMPAKADHGSVPWVTYTDPEVAHVGLQEGAARDRHGDRVRAVSFSFADNDRAQAERATDGLIKAVIGRKGRVLGATIVGPRAGELILTWVLAVQKGLGIGTIAGLIAPYPTLSEVSKRVAGAYYTPSLFSPRTRKIVAALQHLP